MLAEKVNAIANPPAQPVPEPPAMAASIDGKLLRLDENPLGWQTARLDFEGDQATLTVSTTSIPDERQFDVGLDGLYRLTDQKLVETIGIPKPYQRNFLNPYEFNFLLGMPVDGAVAMKGEWTAEDIFIITVQDTRDFDRERLSFKFKPPVVTVTWNSEIDGFYLPLKGLFPGIPH